MVENFKLEFCRPGAIVGPGHPLYHKNVLMLNVNNMVGTVVDEREGYSLNPEVVVQIKDFVINNLKVLKKLAKKKDKLREGELAIFLGLACPQANIEVTALLHKVPPVFQQLMELIRAAINNGAVYRDANTPDPVKEEQEYCQKLDEEAYASDLKHYQWLVATEKKTTELLAKLRATPLYQKVLTPQRTAVFEYSPVVEEVFQMMGVDSIVYAEDKVEDFLETTLINKLSPRKIVDQFIYWRRQEKITPRVTAQAIENGDFVNLFAYHWQLKEQESADWRQNFEAKMKQHH